MNWHDSHKIEPLKRIQVSLISAQDLKKLQQPQKKKVHKKKVAKVLKKKKVKPLAPKPKPKPKPKPIKKVIKKSAPEPDFDPFAPVESSTNKTPKAASKPQPDLVNIRSQQLSSQEIDRYIAMMQAAVQQHWKVPAGLQENLPDPVVEMILRRDGSVASVKILNSSGNALLDQTLIHAIRSASPFTIPREQFESFQHNRLRFHPLK
ncbi:MAG: energy transducer TonB [Mariprofundaceae bacterium]